METAHIEYLTIECARFGRNQRRVLTGARVDGLIAGLMESICYLGELTPGGYLSKDKTKRVFMDEVFDLSLFTDEMGELFIEDQEKMQAFFAQAAPFIQKKIKVYSEPMSSTASRNLALCAHMNDPYDRG